MGPSLNGLGIVLRNLGRPQDAVPLYLEALDRVEPETPPASVAGRMHNLGTAYWEMGELDLAFETLSETLQLKRSLGPGSGLCSTLVSLANVHSDRGEEIEQEALLRECLEKASGPARSLAAMQNLGALMRKQDRVNEAAELFEAGYNAALERGDRSGALNLTEARAVLELKRERPERALALVDAVLAAEPGTYPSEAVRDWIFLHMARSHALGELGRLDEAHEAAELAHGLAADLEIPDVRWQLWHHLGRSRLAVGDRVGAVEAFTAAVEVLEDWRSDVSRAGDRAGFLHRKLAPYHRMLEMEIEDARIAAALAVSEKIRARALHDALVSIRRGEAPGPQVPGEWTLPEDAAIVAFTVTVRRLWMWSRPPLRGPGRPPFDFAEVAEGGRWTSVPLRESDLVDRVESVRRALSERRVDIGPRLSELGELLLGPVAEDLKEAHRLHVVPDGPLWDLPFAALELDGAPLVQRMAVSSVPSLAVLSALRRRSGGGRVSALVLGGADAHGEVAEQARAVAKVYGVGARVDDQARRGSLSSLLAAGPGVLHLAAHGVVDTVRPARSYVQLEPPGRDGRLDAAALAALDLGSVELAVLAACESGRGGVRRGEGMLGLAWAALSAGAGNVLISHWRVDAGATEDFMVLFHRRVAAGGDEAAAALRSSMLELAADPATAHPFYWAGFSLVGSGRLPSDPSPRPAADLGR
ncbi:MAG: CHAT domain-containing protein [Acidobacteriota bacterium]